MKKIILSENAQKVAQSRYFMEGEDWENCVRRVSNMISTPEVNNKQKIQDEFFETIYNMDFLPAGRILRNSGRPKGSLINCFHVPIGDSIEEIGQCLKDTLVLWAEGAGVGINFSSLRPKNDAILGKGGKSSGLVSFMEAFDAAAGTIESGGARRAAALGHVDVSHPEVIDFIDAKLKHGKLSHFNISVAVTEEFLLAVESDSTWTFKFKQKEYNSVKARDIWNKIVQNMVQCAEPGLMNWSNFQKNNSYYFLPVNGTNPCITGETLVAVADGRNYVTIKQLAEENKDVPVYSFNEKTKNTEVKIMRNPRITGYNKKILKIKLDDGSYFRCTDNHKIYMKDGSTKEAKELKNGDSLNHMIKFHAEIKEIIKNSNSNSQDYIWIDNGFKKSVKSEHRLIAEFDAKRTLKLNEVVHHKDRNGLNNSTNNLEIMTREQHNKYHSQFMKGENNQMNRFPEKNWLIKQDWSGEKNGRYKGFNHKDIFKIAVEYSKKYNRRLTSKEWYDICKVENLPIDQIGIKNTNDKILYVCDLLKYAALEANVFVYENSGQIIAYKKFLQIKNETDLNIFFNDSEENEQRILVKKNCEGCGNEFITSWGLRERCFCSKKCANKYKLNSIKGYENKQKNIRDLQLKIYNNLKIRLDRDPLQEEWIEECKKENISHRIRSRNSSGGNKYCFFSYKELKNESTQRNYKIMSIDVDGYEDVYNGTVDENHNFYIMVNETKTNTGKIQYNHILNRQCGETCLSNYESCDLGSLVLPNFITGNVNTNWKKIETTVKTAVRFLDNVLEVNKYTLKEIDINSHKTRRIGLGVIGLAEYLFAKKLRYGSEKAVAETERLMRFIRDSAYQASMELAVEKGSFPFFEPIQYGKASFVRKLPAPLRMDIKKYGIRNCTSMALAPTGTISLLTDYSSGIEPLFAKALKRNDRVGERMYIHPKYKEILDSGESIPEWYVDSYDLKPSDHFEMQVVCQKYCDGAVSKTINLPKETTDEDLSNLLLEYIHDLKGCTVYRDGSRAGQILNKITDEEVRTYLKDQKETQSSLQDGDMKCASGSCEL